MSYPKLTNIILDSSVIAKWFFPAEENSEIALAIKDRFIAKDIMIHAPTLLFYEMNNLIRSAIKSLRVNEEIATLAYQGFLELDLIVYSSKALMKTTLEKAISLEISSYDAAYIALAEYLQIPVYTVDQKLLARTVGKLVKDLKDYPE